MTKGRESRLYSNEYVQKGDTDPDSGKFAKQPVKSMLDSQLLKLKSASALLNILG